MTYLLCEDGRLPPRGQGRGRRRRGRMRGREGRPRRARGRRGVPGEEEAVRRGQPTSASSASACGRPVRLEHAPLVRAEVGDGVEHPAEVLTPARWLQEAVVDDLGGDLC